MILPLANYSTSRDYRRLWELAHDHSIVCVIYGIYRDIATTRCSTEWSPDVIQVCSRGLGHIWAKSIEDFIAQCEDCNLEWLQPLPNPEVTP